LKQIILFLILILSLASCSGGLENLGSISIKNVSSDTIILRETTIELQEGDVVELWNDMSIETKQKDKVHVFYGLEHYLEGKSRGGMKLDALKTNPTILESKESARGRLVWSFQGKMAHIDILESGKYTFKAAVFTSDKELILNRASLIFKRRNK